MMLLLAVPSVAPLKLSGLQYAILSYLSRPKKYRCSKRAILAALHISKPLAKAEGQAAFTDLKLRGLISECPSANHNTSLDLTPLGRVFYKAAQPLVRKPRDT